jgi:predicted HicB family RNase H-like nuclease
MKMEKKFLLRVQDNKTYTQLEKLAKEKRWSVNTLINSILEDAVKKDKKKLAKSLD